MKKINENINDCNIELRDFTSSVILTSINDSVWIPIEDFSKIYLACTKGEYYINDFMYKNDKHQIHIVTTPQYVSLSTLDLDKHKNLFQMTWETFHVYAKVVLNKLSILALPTVKSSEYQPALELDLLDEYDLTVSILNQSAFRGAPYIAFDRGNRWNYIGQRNFVRAYKKFVDKKIQSYEVRKKHLSLKFVQSSDPKKLVLEFYGMNRADGRYYYIFRHVILVSHLESYIETYVKCSTKEK